LPAILSHSDKKDEEFLRNIMTTDKTWMHHYETKTKLWSMEYHHKGSPAKKKKISKPKLGQEAKATVFWETDGVIHMDFPEHGTTINSQPLHCNTQNFETTIKKS
jgi:hypothetical protein